MIAGLLRVLVKVVAVAAIAAITLTIVGDYARQLVPESYHQAIWITGLLIAVPCAVGAVQVWTSPTPRARRFENLLVVGTAVGALLYLLFITGVDCNLVQSSRGRLSVKCSDPEQL
jgi:hypothetical protein